MTDTATLAIFDLQAIRHRNQIQQIGGAYQMMS
ncbi:hypothetical protein [Proteus terrae]